MVKHLSKKLLNLVKLSNKSQNLWHLSYELLPFFSTPNSVLRKLYSGHCIVAYYRDRIYAYLMPSSRSMLLKFYSQKTWMRVLKVLPPTQILRLGLCLNSEREYCRLLGPTLVCSQGRGSILGEASWNKSGATIILSTRTHWCFSPPELTGKAEMSLYEKQYTVSCAIA